MELLLSTCLMSHSYFEWKENILILHRITSWKKRLISNNHVNRSRAWFSRIENWFSQQTRYGSRTYMHVCFSWNKVSCRELITLNFGWTMDQIGGLIQDKGIFWTMHAGDWQDNANIKSTKSSSLSIWRYFCILGAICRDLYTWICASFCSIHSRWCQLYFIYVFQIRFRRYWAWRSKTQMGTFHATNNWLSNRWACWS